jgi:hypothetical protein
MRRLIMFVLGASLMAIGRPPRAQSQDSSARAVADTNSYAHLPHLEFTPQIEPGNPAPNIPRSLLDSLAMPARATVSVGQVSRVVRRATRDATVVPALVAALRSKRPLVRLRAADALEKISRRDAKAVGVYRRQLIHAVARTSDPVVRWNLIQLLPRLSHDRNAMRRRTRRLVPAFR